MNDLLQVREYVKNNNLQTIKMLNTSMQFKLSFYDKYILDNSDLTEDTLKGYKTALKQFILWLKDNDIKNPNRDDIKAYKLYLKDKSFTTGTKNQYIRAVKHLFKWLNSENLYPNIADNIKGFKDIKDIHKKDAFTEKAIQKILDDIDTNTIIGKRDYAMMLLMLTTGLRIKEVSNIDIADIEFKNDVYVVYIKGKGHTEKDTPKKIIKPVYDAISDYLKTRGNYKITEPLFTSTSNRALNKRITRETISTILKTYFKNSGYDSKRLTAHSLRHTTGTLLIKSGADIYKTQKHLRHKDPKTTEIYINTNDNDIDTSEQDIYNQIFDASKQGLIKDVRDDLNDLDMDTLKQVFKYIKDVKGGC